MKWLTIMPGQQLVQAVNLSGQALSPLPPGPTSVHRSTSVSASHTSPLYYATLSNDGKRSPASNNCKYMFFFVVVVIVM